VVDEVLRQHARRDRLADTAFFAADEIDGAHELLLPRVG
jgi:hypothetical protein